MPLAWVEPELFLEHNCVRIYRTYRHDMGSDPSEFIFTTDVTDSDRDSDSEFHFDVRDKTKELSKVWVGRTHFLGDNKSLLKECVDYGLIPLPDDVMLDSLVEKLGCSGPLLELVHEVAATAASNVNNSGPRAQLQFLVESIGLEETKKIVKETLGEVGPKREEKENGNF